MFLSPTTTSPHHSPHHSPQQSPRSFSPLGRRNSLGSKPSSDDPQKGLAQGIEAIDLYQKSNINVKDFKPELRITADDNTFSHHKDDYDFPNEAVSPPPLSPSSSMDDFRPTVFIPKRTYTSSSIASARTGSTAEDYWSAFSTTSTMPSIYSDSEIDSRRSSEAEPADNAFLSPIGHRRNSKLKKDSKWLRVKAQLNQLNSMNIPPMPIRTIPEEPPGFPNPYPHEFTDMTPMPNAFAAVVQKCMEDSISRTSSTTPTIHVDRSVKIDVNDDEDEQSPINSQSTDLLLDPNDYLSPRRASLTLSDSTTDISECSVSDCDHCESSVKDPDSWSNVLIKQIVDSIMASLPKYDQEDGLEAQIQYAAGDSQQTIDPRSPESNSTGSTIRGNQNHGQNMKPLKRVLSEPDENEDDNFQKQRKTGPDDKVKLVQRLACPFYKHNPAKYKPNDICAKKGWLDTHRTK
jgi:hypothetical protein